MRLRHFFALLLFLLVNNSTGGEASAVIGISTTDWSEVSALADRSHRPLLLVVTAPDCGYCQRLKNEVLSSLDSHRDLAKRVIIREMDLHSSGKVVDFNGELVRARMFLSRYGVFATPTVLFLDSAGQSLREPLVGYNGTELYLPELYEAVEESARALSVGGAHRMAGRDGTGSAPSD
jgi:thioredoxin-related protein